MSILLRSLLSRYMAPAGDGGSDTGGAGDRGDDFTPTDDDTDVTVADKAADKSDADGKGAGDAKDDDKEGEDDKDGEAKGDDKSDKSARKDTRIPLARHKEMLEKERARRTELEEQLKKFQHGTQVATMNDKITESESQLIKMEKEYTALLADGEVAKAAETMTKIRQLDRQIAASKSSMDMAAAEARAVEQVRYETTLERVEGAYPELNPEHDDYDETRVNRVVRISRALQKDGETPSKALQEAVKLVMGEPKTAKQETATEATARVDAKDVAAERKKQAVSKAVAASQKTPPSTSKVGMDSDKAGGGLSAKDVQKMSQEEFMKLPDDVLRKMRGDDFGG